MLNQQYEKWNMLSPLGLLLIGFGLSLTAHAATAKSEGKGWFIKGTLGLIITNAGIAIFGEAVKSRTLYESELERLRRND